MATPLLVRVQDCQLGVDGSTIVCSGTFMCGQGPDMGMLAWLTEYPITYSVNQMRGAIFDAAIAAAANFNFIITANDTKIMYGGPS